MRFENVMVIYPIIHEAGWLESDLIQTAHKWTYKVISGSLIEKPYIDW